MKRFSAQYLITNNSPLLKRAIITTGDDGTITGIEDTSGDLREMESVEFHNGIIIPGFVNCHCHLELSHMKGSILPGIGLGTFVEQIRSTRIADNEKIISAAAASDSYMFKEGISLCGDICNTTDTFAIKKESRIRYLNLVEVFGIDPDKASKRMDEALRVSAASEKAGIPWTLVPHAAYSMSLTLLNLLFQKSEKNMVTSIHFMETAGEKEFLETHSGELMDSYRKSVLIPPRLETVKNHKAAILNKITSSGNMILVHNTFVDREIILSVKSRKNIYWCLCPNSNDYIEKAIPPVDLLREENCEIVIGTDSLASNSKLSILSELKTLQSHFPELSIEELIKWATLNGAKALGEEEHFGRIEAGKKPGLLLLKNVDLINMKLTPDSFVTRLV